MPIRQALLARASAASTSPEPFASHVDILTAAQDMETAIHARSGLAAAAAIRSAQAQVLHAAAYLKLAGAPALSAQGAALAKQLAALAAAAAGKSGATLAAFQGQTLYAFQGQLRSFNAAVRALGHRGAAVGAVSLGRPRPRRGRGLFATSGVLTITPGQAVALPVTVTVSASFPVYWSCAVQAVDQSGAVMAQATKQASGSASFDLTLGPLNTAGAQVSFRGTLNAYADAAMTQAIPGSPATASTGVEVAVQETASSSGASFSFGAPAATSLPVGGTLTLQGASVNAPGLYWSLNVQAVASNGAVLGSTGAGGSGSAAFTLNIGPLNASGTAVHLVGSLALWSDAARTQSVSGSPITRTSGTVATIAAQASAPATAPSLSGSVNQTTGLATIQWSAVSGAAAYEVLTNGGQGSLGGNLASWGNGTLTFDSTGAVGFFTTATSGQATIPVGTTTVAVRATTGVGKTALLGPLSNAVQLVESGQPNLSVQGLSATAGSGFYGPVVNVASTVRNTGNAPGTAASGWSGVVVGPDGHVWAVLGNSNAISVPAGGGVGISASSGLGDPGAGSNAPSGTYTVYVALGQGYQAAGYYIGSYTQPFRGAVSGSASTQVQVP